ncbi:MAG: hypothetical protein AAF236_11670 [Verrucomicrobiota bacterium]
MQQEQQAPFTFARLFAGLVVLALLSSCAAAKQRRADRTMADAFAEIAQAQKQDEAVIEELKAIAASPSAQLPDRPLSSDDASDASEPMASEALPEIAEGLKPESLNVGDIFRVTEDGQLIKAGSLADLLPQVDEAETGALWYRSEAKRQPLTISQSELATLRETAPDPDALPTRSVALDAFTVKKTSSPTSLEQLFAKGRAGEVSYLEDESSQNRFRSHLASIQTELEAGATYYVITGVTQSNAIQAYYPGAPLGSRDVEPIRNAVSQMYPQFGDIEAEKSSNRVTLFRDPQLYWDFEAHQLKWHHGQFKVGQSTLAQS